MAQLGRLVRLERMFLQEVEDYADLLRAALDTIQEYSGQVDQETRQGEVENIIGNPVSTYQLIKRLSVFWRNVEVGQLNSIKVIYTLSSVQHSESGRCRHAGQTNPTEEKAGWEAAH